jgi:hypothetical protein
LGLNFVGGGIDRIGSGGLGSLVPSTLTVVLEPPAARAVGAGWRLAGKDTSWRMSGNSIVLPGGLVNLEFSPAPGFATPAPRTIDLPGGNATLVSTNVYVADENRPTLASLTLTIDRKIRFSVQDNTSSTYVIEVTQDFSHWDPLQTNRAPFVFEAPVTSLSPRFLRARTPNP